MSTRASTELRRAEIVRAFATVLTQHGYEAATIARIARQAGLSPGLVHYHFANKAEILMALVDGLTAGLQARIDKRREAATTPLDRLDALVDGLLARGADADAQAAAAWASVAAEAVRREDVQAVYAAWVLRLRDLFAVALAEAGDSRPHDGAVIATALVEGLFGLGAAAPSAVAAGSAAPLVRANLRAWLAAGGGR